MRDDEILTAQGDPQSLGQMDGYPDSMFRSPKFGLDENMVSLLKRMSHDIRSPLMAIVSTLKLLNRGYYGKMDEEAADKITEVLSSATRLSEMVEHYLEEWSPEPKAAE
jgi:signal transduction histidine kinase